jgi:glycosyltransferase involved in cell wall biosynthesis
MKVTILSHNLTSNAAMRAHRLGLAAREFAEVTVLGPVKRRGAWGALPEEPWIQPVESKKLPKFFETMLELVAHCDGDVVIAVKPYLASYGVGLLAAQARRVPLILDLDDLDVALAKEPDWKLDGVLEDMRDPASRVYLKVLSRATQAASAITVASSRLQQRFGGILVPHGCPTERFDPARIDRAEARRHYGFSGPVVLFPGTRRTHKGLIPLAKAVNRIADARLAVLCRPEDFIEAEWDGMPLIRLPILPYAELPNLLSAADVVAIPQLDREGARHQMPMKVYDAMAMAKPIVASTVSDLPVALEGCARLVPPGDVHALADAIQSLLLDPTEGRRLGERARVRCLETYSIPRVAEALSKAVQQAKVAHGGNGQARR